MAMPMHLGGGLLPRQHLEGGRRGVKIGILTPVDERGRDSHRPSWTRGRPPGPGRCCPQVSRLSPCRPQCSQSDISGEVVCYDWWIGAPRIDLPLANRQNWFSFMDQQCILGGVQHCGVVSLHPTRYCNRTVVTEKSLVFTEPECSLRDRFSSGLRNRKPVQSGCRAGLWCGVSFFLSSFLFYLFPTSDSFSTLKENIIYWLGFV